MNTFILAGNIGQDAQVKTINEKSYVAFSVAENQRFLDKETGEFKNLTNWYSILYRGEKIAEYLKKGVTVQVVGELTIDTFRSERDGMVKVTRNVYANQIQLLSSNPKEQTQQPTAETATAAPAAAPEVPAESNEPLPY